MILVREGGGQRIHEQRTVGFSFWDFGERCGMGAFSWVCGRGRGGDEKAVMGKIG